MSRPTELAPLGDVIRRFDLGARKRLGQHFLLDLNLTRRIVRAAGDLAGRIVVEIGPGPGGLTRALLESPAERVIAIERDARCLAALAELEAREPGRLRVMAGDALEVEYDGLAPAPAVVVANLPYNISTALLLRWLTRPDRFEGYTLMFQKEVAARLGAGPGTKAYGRLTVMTQWRCRVEPCFDVPARAFTPPPKVRSSVVRLTPRPAPLAAASRSLLEAVTAAAFGQRRKMLRQSLKSLGVQPAALCEQAGVDPTARAEALTIAEFCALARALSDLRGAP